MSHLHLQVALRAAVVGVRARGGGGEGVSHRSCRSRFLRSSPGYRQPVELSPVKPGNRIDVLPAAAGRLLVSVTVTVSPLLTISVGPGICMLLRTSRVDHRWRERSRSAPPLQP